MIAAPFSVQRGCADRPAMNSEQYSARYCTTGEAYRALSDNRERYIAQSAGVAFGLLPHRLTDLPALARTIRQGAAHGRA